MIKTNKVKCPYCGRSIALTKNGFLNHHKNKASGTKCARSGGRPN